MRAEHRHELKTNELALWLSNLPIWVKQNTRTITYVSAVVVIVAASYFYHRYQKTVVAGRERIAVTGLLAQLPDQKVQIAQAQAQGADVSYTLLQVANELDNIAGSAKKDAVAAMALIKEAEILRTETHFRLGTVSQQDLTTQINQAKEDYTKALNTYLKRSPNCSLEALANLGLGLCEEELGNFDEARKIYNEVATNTAFDGTTAAAAAKQRLVSMDSFNQKLVLKPAPAAAAEPPAMPAEGAEIQPAPSAIEGAAPAQTSPVVPEANAPGLY
jgi:tetratricopeptide (TPR) repeat protein